MESKLTRRWQRGLGAGAIAGVVTLAGCGGSSSPAASGSGSAGSAGSSASGGAAAAAGQHVTIVGNSSLRFSPMTVHLHTGTVKITLKDMGSYPHDIVIPALGVTSKTVTGDLGSGSVSFLVTFHHQGRYPFHCQYHQSAGMVGVFVVS
jgi:plastocyanin